MLQFLPTKLAEWIGENMQDELGFPDKRDPDKWRVSELNDILRNHLVRNRNGCSLRTFGCVEWESEMYLGIMRARCYPFNLKGHRFHNMNIQVLELLDNAYTVFIPCISLTYTAMAGYGDHCAPPSVRARRPIGSSS